MTAYLRLKRPGQSLFPRVSPVRVTSRLNPRDRDKNAYPTGATPASPETQASPPPRNAALAHSSPARQWTATPFRAREPSNGAAGKRGTHARHSTPLLLPSPHRLSVQSRRVSTRRDSSGLPLLSCRVGVGCLLCRDRRLGWCGGLCRSWRLCGSGRRRGVGARICSGVRPALTGRGPRTAGTVVRRPRIGRIPRCG